MPPVYAINKPLSSKNCFSTNTNGLMTGSSYDAKGYVRGWVCSRRSGRQDSCPHIKDMLDHCKRLEAMMLFSVKRKVELYGS